MSASGGEGGFIRTHRFDRAAQSAAKDRRQRRRPRRGEPA